MGTTVEHSGHSGRADATRLGPYRLVSEVGRGGMGVVHLGLDPSGRAVAVKVLHPHVAADPAARARLAREVAHLSRIDHPRVARIVGADVDGPQPYVVTRFVPGRALDHHVSREGPLRGDALLALARDLSDALGAVHGAGLVHRDLKPGNVLLDDGRAVVIDFGIAFGEADARLTMTGLVMGTPGFLAPEILDGGAVTAATDWWAWAATLAFAASGRVPFGDSPVAAVLARIRSGECDLTGVDARLAPLLAAALDPDPRRRPGRAVILEALERYARGDDVTAALPAVPRTAVMRGLPGAVEERPGSAAAWTRQEPQAVGRQAVDRQAPYVGFHAAPAPRPVEPAPRPVEPARREVEPARREVEPEPHEVGPQTYQQPLPPPAHAAPPSRRTGSVIALGVLLAAVAAVAPPAWVAAGLAWSWLSRTVDRTARGLYVRRGQRGPRRGDLAGAMVRAPGHAVLAIIATLLSGLLPVFVAGAVLLGIAGAGTLGMGPPRGPSSASALFAAAWLGMMVGWWGAGGGPLRRGSRVMLRALAPGRVGAVAAVVVLLVAAAGLGLVSQSSGFSPAWWPLIDDPFGWAVTRW